MRKLPDVLEHTQVEFGKHKGLTWADIVRRDPNYVIWWFGTDNPGKIGAKVLAALQDVMESDSAAENEPIHLPVEWREYADRSEFIAEYVTIGAMPGVMRNAWAPELPGKTKRKAEALGKVLSQSVFLLRRDRRGISSEMSRFAASLLEKVLTRGSTPLPTLSIEQSALELHGPFDSLRNFSDDHEQIGWQSDLKFDEAAVISALIERDNFELDSELDYTEERVDPLMGSLAEASFLNEWVPTELGRTAGHWFTPQASLGALRGSTSDHRRIDFLFCHPLLSRPLAIEIDGLQHDRTAIVDNERDRSLPHGFEIIRVPTAEVLQGRGHSLAKIRERLSGLFAEQGLIESRNKIAELAIDCTIAAKVQLAVAGALWRGWLRPGRHWKIRLRGARSPSAAGVIDLLDMLKAIEVIYGSQVTPPHCSIEIDHDCPAEWQLDDTGNGDKHGRITDTSECDNLTIAVEFQNGPFHTVRCDDSPDCIIRPVYLPITFIIPPKLPGKVRRKARDVDYQANSRIHYALRLFLRHIYRKREFREGQGKALLNALRHIDTIVLLPTGGGKSIIYQLGGLLMPGVTLVVDPLIALMNDQVEGLYSYGIDRALAIFHSDPATLRRKIQLVELGQYQFILVSPERVQSPRFREAIHGLSAKIPINLAVIDEAHCVSEWGHDFRPAYLSLANSIRSFKSSREQIPPPLLALTGTASRAVLRDIINDLEIDRNDSNALIRPESFDRKEIGFRIIKTIPAYAAAMLRAELRRLPAELGMPVTEYFKARGGKTNSGIVFVPTVAGTTGIDQVGQHVKDATTAPVTFYSGEAPQSSKESSWEKTKRKNAHDFKYNRAPMLIATKAYGMGIDKPNIRYTIHYGVPHSLEQYYQEAGRAGRDRLAANSTLILAETSEARSDSLLDPALDLESLRRLSKETASDYDARDDITRALFFHLQAFPGTNREIEDVKYLIWSIINQPTEIPISLPFKDPENYPQDSKTSKEKAIYRLYKLGFVKDYTVDFGSRVFKIITAEFDFGQFRDRLLAYIRNVAPGKLGSTRRKIQEIREIGESETERKHHVLLGLAKVFIEFIYDEIERARRRAIQEVILLARQSESDAEIRRRLLDYLHEGVGFEKIDELIQCEHVDLHEWISLLDKVGNPIEAGELRGLCIRALESSPDHPGLLLIRGVAEVMTSDYYWNVATTNIAGSVIVGIEKYDITVGHIEGVFGRLFSHYSTGLARPAETDRLEPVLAFALLDLALDHGQSFAADIVMSKCTRSSNYETMAILEWYRSDQLVKWLDEIVTFTINDLQRSSMPDASLEDSILKHS